MLPRPLAASGFRADMVEKLSLIWFSEKSRTDDLPLPDELLPGETGNMPPLLEQAARIKARLPVHAVHVALLSECNGSPHYGRDKSERLQRRILLEDISQDIT
jgi:hypothetical protein